MGDKVKGRYPIILMVSLLLFSVLAAGCIDENGDEEDEEIEDDEGPSIPGTTTQLSGDTLDSIVSVSEDKGDITFQSSDPVISGIEKGDVLSFGISEKTPYGLLRKVTGIERSGSRTTLKTEQATIEEAVEDGRAEYNQTLSQPLKTVESNAGVVMKNNRTRSADDGIGFEDVVLYEEGGAKILLNGYLDLDFELIFILDIEDFHIVECTFGTRTTFDGELSVTSDGELEVDVEITVARFEFTPVIIPIGGVQIVIVPVLSLLIGSSGTVSSGFTMSAGQNTVLESTVSHPDWAPVKDFTSNFEYQTPQITGGYYLRCYAGPRMDLLLYGVVGPFIKAQGYVRSESNDEGNWWLYGGLSFGIGFRIEVLGKTIKEWEDDSIIDFGRLIASSMDDLAGGWVVEKLDIGLQMTDTLFIEGPGGEIAVLYTSIDPDTGYFPIRMASLHGGIWSFEELVYSNSDDRFDACFGPGGELFLAYYDGGMDQKLHLDIWDKGSVDRYEYRDGDMPGRYVSEIRLTLDERGWPNIYYVLFKSTGSGGFFEYADAILKKAVLSDGVFTNSTILKGEEMSLTGLDMERAGNGDLHLAYFKVNTEGYGQELIHSKYSDGAWSNRTIFQEETVWNNPSLTFLEIDGNGDPVVLFDDNNGSVHFMRYSSGNWVKGESPGVKSPEMGLVSLYLIDGATPVCSYMDSSGTSGKALYYSVLREEGWDRVEPFNWTGWRFPGGTNIAQSGEKVLVAFNDGSYLRIARKDL